MRFAILSLLALWCLIVGLALVHSAIASRTSPGRFGRAWWCSVCLTGTVASLIMMACLRPLDEPDVQGRPRLLIVLDSSWSMQTRLSSGVTRWQEAQREALALLEASPAQQIAVASTADGIVHGWDSDRDAVWAALVGLQPRGGEDETWPAIAAHAEVHLFTDGRVARALNAAVVVHTVFEPDPVAGMTRFATNAGGRLVSDFN